MSKLNKIDYILFCCNNEQTTKTFIVYKNGTKKLVSHQKGLTYMDNLSQKYDCSNKKLVHDSKVIYINEKNLEKDYPDIFEFSEKKNKKKKISKKIKIALIPILIPIIIGIGMFFRKHTQKNTTPRKQTIIHDIHNNSYHPNLKSKKNEEKTQDS